jgi:hypothetical protein
VQYKDAEGRWRVEHAGTNRQAAVRLLARRKREAAKGVQVNRDASPRTHLDSYAKRWNARQRRIGKRNADFIVPDPRNMAARTQSQTTKAHKRDAELIGVPNKGSHGFRRFMISAARSSGARSDVLEQIRHNARGAIIDVYTSWEWPALCEAVSCLRVDPDRLPGRIYDISYDICVSENANRPQSLRLISGGGGNRTILGRPIMRVETEIFDALGERLSRADFSVLLSSPRCRLTTRHWLLAHP